MKNENVQAAVQEARRFIKRADAWQRAERQIDWQASKEGGAVRRASMDLTRALADMRRPG